MKGKWAAGIPPRNFTWVIKDHLAVSERPGGYARSHRPVRRQEEIIYLREQGFSRVVSLLGSPHNLHAYEEIGLTWAHFPLPPVAESGDVLLDIFRYLDEWLGSGEKILLHEEDMGDRVMGVMAGYLLWGGKLPSGPVAIAALEKMAHRQMGSAGRQIVALVTAIVRAAGAADGSTPAGDVIATEETSPATGSAPASGDGAAAGSAAGNTTGPARPPAKGTVKGTVKGTGRSGGSTRSRSAGGARVGKLPSVDSLVWRGSEIVVAESVTGTGGDDSGTG